MAVGVTGVLVAGISGAAWAGVLGPKTSFGVIAKAVSQHDVHWRLKASQKGSGPLCIDVYERGPGGSGMYGCQGNKAPCGEVGIATHGVRQVVGGEVRGRLLTASGQVTTRARSVVVRIKDDTGEVRQAHAQVEFVSRADARAMGVNRFGWWFAAFDRAEFDQTTTATAINRNGRPVGPRAVFEEDEFGCEPPARPGRRG
jgi:hypothetical protein